MRASPPTFSPTACAVWKATASSPHRPTPPMAANSATCSPPKAWTSLRSSPKWSSGLPRMKTPVIRPWSASSSGTKQDFLQKSAKLAPACVLNHAASKDNFSPPGKGIQCFHSSMAETSGSARVQAVDALRGAIVIIMALDHVRDFIHISAMSFSPTDLTRTTAGLFFTRWITHFCAPVFAFTAGIGAFFWYYHGRTLPQLSRFLVTRGLWLMFLELTWLRFILLFQWKWNGAIFILTVFWMLGLSMVVLAALLHLPPKILVPLSLAVIATHNLLDPVRPDRFGQLAPLFDILHQQAVFPFHGALFVVAYPLVPWFAVMAAGFSFGTVFLWDPERRRSFVIRLGLGLTVLFVALRAWNHYGDAVKWSHQPTLLFTALSFLNTSKYPPSLLFLLMTLGPALLVLGYWNGR